MNKEFDTLELARIYESQGYFNEAFEMYKSLSKTNSGNEIKSALTRMEKRRNPVEEKADSESRIHDLLKEYLGLIILKNRLNTINNIIPKP